MSRINGALYTVIANIAITASFCDIRPANGQGSYLDNVLLLCFASVVLWFSVAVLFRDSEVWRLAVSRVTYLGGIPSLYLASQSHVKCPVFTYFFYVALTL
jgi:hypothetical protein